MRLMEKMWRIKQSLIAFINVNIIERIKQRNIKFVLVVDYNVNKTKKSFLVISYIAVPKNKTVTHLTFVGLRGG